MPGTSVTPRGTEIPYFARRGHQAMAGAAAAFLLRSLGDKTGIPYSPTAERLLFELTSATAGKNVDSVAAWLASKETQLRGLGYRVVSRRVALRPPFLLDWVKNGKGFRGAILQVDRGRLHGQDPQLATVDPSHAVALCVEPRKSRWAVTMVDPHPGSEGFTKPPVTLEAAHRIAKHGGVVLHWTGWS